MLKIAGVVLLALIASICVYAAFKPAEYLISREITIQAAPEKIFPYLLSARRNNDWMPWAEMDPQIKMTYSGPEEGVGSTASWESPGKMGVGSSTIAYVIDNELVETRLEYVKPFQMKQVAQLTLQPTDGKTIVRWTVSGRSQFVGRLMCIFMDMDKMVGPSFEKGLARLKGMAEAAR